MVDTILVLFPPFRPAARAAGEAHNVASVIMLGQANDFARQSFADEHVFPAPFDVA
jgi:hypothetical protein